MPRQTHSHYFQRIYRQQRAASAIILHYDAAARDLRSWFWPVHADGSRVTPMDLLAHRITHEFRAPCCLCASNTTTGINYTETAIYMPTCGTHFGEYVATCALDCCGYFVRLEVMYAKRGLMLRKYLVRSSEVAPPPVMYAPQSHLPDMNPLASAIVVREPPASSGRTSVIVRLLRLDSCIRAGLPEAEFNSLFAKCRCGLVMTRRVFGQHVCAVVNPVVIDLTSDSEDSEDNNIIDLTADSDDD